MAVAAAIATAMMTLPASAQVPVRTGLTLDQFYSHDPFIVAHQESKTYYLYNGAGPRQLGGDRSGVIAYKSKDLQHWDGPYVVFTVPDGIWADPAQGVWAPEVHRYRGKYYLFATLHNNQKLLPYKSEDELPTYQEKKAKPHLRGTQIFVADTPDGPFRVFGKGETGPPMEQMTLDGTLWVEDGKPNMVYAHEWIQVWDGTMEAIELTPDLGGRVGQPKLLFRASEAPWVKAAKPGEPRKTYVTDGPWLHKTKTGKLVMLWSSYRDGLYVETIATSQSGKLAGPWKQGEVLVGEDSGHGMLFHAFDGRLMLVLHQPFRQARAKLFEVDDSGDTLRIVRKITP